MMRMDRMFVALAAFGGLLSLGCQVKCGAGTADKNGECVATAVVSPATCAPGTHLVGTECVSSSVCGANTVLTDGGVCEGTGGGTTMGCDSALPCPTQGTGRYCVSGRVTRWPDDGKPLAMRAKVTPTDGVCVKIYSPTDFVVGNVMPLGTPAEAMVDDCGRFLIADIPETSTKFVAAGSGDCGAIPGPTLPDNAKWAFAAVGGEQVPGQSTIDMASSQTTVIAMSAEEVRSLRTQAGRDIYSQGGGYIAVFRDPRSSTFPPVQGVQLFGVSDDYINMSNAIYFGADLVTLDPSRTFTMGTGVTGAVLVNPPHVTQHSGRGDSGMIPWDTILGGSADGAIFIQRWRLKRQ